MESANAQSSATHVRTAVSRIKWVAAPRGAEVAPLAEVHGRLSQARDGAVFFVCIWRPRRRQPAQRTAHALGWILEPVLEPLTERPVEEPLGAGLGEDLEAGVHAGLDGTLAQEVRAEAVDGGDVRLFEVLEGFVERDELRCVLRRTRCDSRASGRTAPSPAPCGSAASARRRLSR